MADNSVSKELKAIQEVVSALSGLDPYAVKRVLEYALSHLGISETPSILQTAAEPGAPILAKATAGEPTKRPSQALIDIKSLKEEKSPSSGIEMAAIVAYYLSEAAPDEDRKADFTTKDAEKYFKQAGFKLPPSMKATLNNAKNAGYLDSAGHGKFKLNPVGYNLVAHNLSAKKSKR